MKRDVDCGGVAAPGKVTSQPRPHSALELSIREMRGLAVMVEPGGESGPQSEYNPLPETETGES